MHATSFHRGDVVRVRDEAWVVLRHTLGTNGSILDVRGRDRENAGTQTSFVLPCEPIERVPASTAPRVVGRGTWRRTARASLAAATPTYDSLRGATHARLTLRPFQLEPVIALIRGVTVRVLIADEVGLGKTIQAGLIISELFERRPDARALVITPAGLRDQWQSELHTRFAIESTVLDSTALTRSVGAWGVNPWAAHRLIVTSLDYVKRPEVVRSLESLVWDLLVFDEAHALAGRSDRATVAAALAERARMLVLLTATPHSGDDEAFARLCAIGNLSHRFPLLVFRRTRADVGLASSRRTTCLRVQQSPAEHEMHRALMAYARRIWAEGAPSRTSTSGMAARLAMTVLMRRACSSAASLARSLETRLGVLASPERVQGLQMTLPFAVIAGDEEPALELSAPGLSDRGEECDQLRHLVHLARLAGHGESKLSALRRFLQRAGEPAIVFTEYRDTLNRLAAFLQDFNPLELHGGLTPSERLHVLRQFSAGTARLLLATDAASEGLNLHQHCRLVINLELPWTPVRLEQRIGRVERLGQTRRVHAVHLLAAGTCEELSVATFVARQEKVARVLGGLRGDIVTERQVASAVVGDTEPEAVSPIALPPGVRVGDLWAIAADEASRLEITRAIASGLEETAVGRRPPITVFRRHGPASRCCCAFHVALEDTREQPLWETLIGVLYEEAPDATAAARVRSTADVRSLIESAVGQMGPTLTAEMERLQASAAASLDAPIALALDRERAIAAALRMRRARLSAELLQPGLFDRRAERAAVAQDAVLDEAFSRCAARISNLMRSGPPYTCRHRLAFGLIRR